MSKFTAYVNKFIPEPIERKLRDFRDHYLRKYKIEELPMEIFDPHLKYYSISFCTTCMNRLFHLKKTIVQNIENNKSYPKIEFVLLNYNSQDEMHEWVRENLSEYISKGILNYYITREPEFFHMSMAKNIAHKLGQGDIVCNLDGDNYTGEHFAYYINYLYNKYSDNNIFNFRKPPYWGTSGRIAVFRDKFLELGGYDEDFDPAGYEDLDFIYRGQAKKMGFHQIPIENFLKYLSNSTKEKSSNFEDENASFYKFMENNKQRSEANIAANRLIANQNGWGKATVYKNFDEDQPIYLD